MTLARDPWLPEPAKIHRIRSETADSFTLELAADGTGFRPGQFNMLYLFGIGEVAISISGDPARPDPTVHTIRAVGTVTRAIARLQKGDVLGVRGPYGNPWPLQMARGQDLLLVAGGLGLAPLRSAIYDLLNNRPLFRNVTLLYGARHPADILYRRELLRWSRGTALDVHITVDHADPSWNGHVGVVPALLDQVPLDPTQTIAMLCGPEVMMRYTVHSLAARGVPSDRVYVAMERNMKCALSFCGHCQYRESFLCKDGPVLRFDRIADLFDRREV